MTVDHARVERQRFLHPEREACMPILTFYGWLFMAFAFGFVAAVVLAGLIGRPI